MTEVVDTPARTAAVNPAASVCVSAPAGSGKTELLIQRYLCLLARVQRPEQVLAITFTRKAAAEMRQRVMQALQGALANTPCDSPHQRVTRSLADLALAADFRGEWHLLGNMSRFNIKTIDSFCAGLIRQMPVLSQFGGQARVQDDVTPLYEEAVQELYKLLEGDHHPVSDDLAALLLHFDNNWDRLQTLLVSMLARREQWRGYVGVHHEPAEAEAYLVATVDTMISDELQELSLLLAPFKVELLELLRFAAVNLGESKPSQFPGTDPEQLHSWRKLRHLLLTNKGGWRKRISKNEGFPIGSGERKQHKVQWQELLSQLQDIDGLHARLAVIQSLPVVEAHSVSWQLVLHLSRLLPTLAAQLLLVFRQHGVVDHSQVAQSALLALGDNDAPTELALRLDYQIEHILVDEFQDTAIMQYELLQKLTRGWGEYNEQNPQAPRTLMIVGDGMQSIYGFRGANVGLFLKARREGFNGVIPQYLELRCNFRSDKGVVDWINSAFRQAFPNADDVYRSQVRYSEATAVRLMKSGSAVDMRAFEGDDARAREVAFICEQVADCTARGEQTIAILGRSRSHLQPIIAQLKSMDIPYNAPDLDGLAQSPVISDLLTLCRALASDADRLAWMALLRAPWCGLTLEDMLRVAQFGDSQPYTPVWSIIEHPDFLSSVTADGRARLLHVIPVLQRAREKRDRLGLRVWVEQTWVDLGGPQCAPGLDSLLDVENYMQLLEQAEAEGVGFDLDWLMLRVQKRFMNAGDPDSRVHLLTLHKAKGLEFDRVIIPQLDRVPRSDDREIMLWDEHSNAEGVRSFLLAADDHSTTDTPTLYNYLKLQRRQKNLLEATRLLYVGATRAISHLLLTARIKTDQKDAFPRSPSELSLLSPLWSTFSQQMTVCAQVKGQESAPPERTPRSLTRLLRSTVPPALHAGAKHVSEVGDRPVANAANYLDRCVGNIVHKALEELSRQTIVPAEPSDLDKQRWRAALQREGLRGKSLEDALNTVLDSVRQTLRVGGTGRWVLATDHIEAHSEWPLTTLDAQGQPRDIVIDRSFIDTKTGVRWVIDYKNGRPVAGESFDTFAARESANYRNQLLCYRNAVRFLGHEPLRCALFFTALGQLHIISELDLPGPGAATTR